ncbi:mycofactocin-coupled SDR family oxidoreductase [Pseudonocardia xishanensis]|uniref:Mycofactocin-coupled SDR family oxidoreductase n=1 Tax=Pseudonocardia xishanensis TaxID=630995 RepID=A0ABP8RV02_9PSEU
MTRRLEGKVAFVTGAARGQGRSHAVRLAEEGADIIAVDIADQVPTVTYPMATPEDLWQTVKEVEARDRRILATVTDVRDLTGLEAAARSGVEAFGRIDVIAANAGISSYGTALELTPQAWRDVLDINLTGVWNTVRAVAPHLVSGGRGGSVVITSSAAGLRGLRNLAHYSAAKHGLVGLMKALAIELAPHSIRVNSLHPGSVLTKMIDNDVTARLFRPDLAEPTREDVAERMAESNLLGVPWLEPSEISNALVFLASDEARFITGVTLPVDAGYVLK